MKSGALRFRHSYCSLTIMLIEDFSASPYLTYSLPQFLSALLQCDFYKS